VTEPCPRGLRVEVTDLGTFESTLEPAPLEAISGRGIQIIAALVDRLEVKNGGGRERVPRVPLVGGVCRVAPGLDRRAAEGTKARYAFVYGDFRRVHRRELIPCHSGRRSGATRTASSPRTSFCNSPTRRTRNASAAAARPPPGAGRLATATGQALLDLADQAAALLAAGELGDSLHE
jgi:hypothetical protein